jgi:hypothetical protein
MRINSRVGGLVLIGFIFTFSTLAWSQSQRDMVCQGSCGGGCGPCPMRSPVPAGPSPEQQEAERAQALAKNSNAGIAAFHNGDYQAAIGFFQEALKYNKYHPVLQANLRKAEAALQEQTRAAAATRSAIPSSSAQGQLRNSGQESTGRLFDNGGAHDDATVDTSKVRDVETPPSQPLDPRLANNKDYQAAAADLTKTTAAAAALNKKMTDLQDQQKANPTPDRQIEIYKLSSQVTEANGAVAIASNKLDVVKKKIITGPAIVVGDDAPGGGQSTLAGGGK